MRFAKWELRQGDIAAWMVEAMKESERLSALKTVSACETHLSAGAAVDAAYLEMERIIQRFPVG